MDIRVLPLPSMAMALGGDVVVVVDVVRATTALVCLFEAGGSRVLLSRGRSDAAKVRCAAGADCVLCAEQDDGTVPDGFDYEPAPSQIVNLNLDGRTAVLATANGTPAAMAAAHGGAALVVVAALRNLRAATERAAREAAKHGTGITIVCSGRLQNSQIALEDVYCAGAIVRNLVSLATDRARPVHLDDSAIIASCLVDVFPDARAALAASMTGRRFAELGREDDVLFCAAVDASRIVPVVVTSGEETAYPVEILDEPD